jgi:hypothetical protein
VRDAIDGGRIADQALRKQLSEWLDRFAEHIRSAGELASSR